MSNAAAAHHYQEMGISVVPVLQQFGSSCECDNRNCRGGRHLALPLNFATTDPAYADKWWGGEQALRGIAHPTGDLVAIDVPDHLCDECGSLPTVLLDALKLPTWIDEQAGVTTFVFKMGSSDEVVWPSQGKVHPQVSIRGGGSWLVLPPSHADTDYAHTWRPGCSPDDLPPANLPAQLLPLLNQFSPREDAETVLFGNGSEYLPCAHCGEYDAGRAESVLLDDTRIRSGFCLGCYEGYERDYSDFPWRRPAGESHPGHLRAPSSEYWVARYYTELGADLEG